MHFGPQDVLVALSLDFVDSGTAAEVEKAVTRIERRIKAAHPEVKRCSSRRRTATPIETTRYRLKLRRTSKQCRRGD